MKTSVKLDKLFPPKLHIITICEITLCIYAPIFAPLYVSYNLMFITFCQCLTNGDTYPCIIYMNTYIDWQINFVVFTPMWYGQNSILPYSASKLFRQLNINHIDITFAPSPNRGYSNFGSKLVYCNKKEIKGSHNWSLIGDRWTLSTRGQWCGTRCHERYNFGSLFRICGFMLIMMKLKLETSQKYNHDISIPGNHFIV